MSKPKSKKDTYRSEFIENMVRIVAEGHDRIGLIAQCASRVSDFHALLRIHEIHYSTTPSIAKRHNTYKLQLLVTAPSGPSDLLSRFQNSIRHSGPFLKKHRIVVASGARATFAVPSSESLTRESRIVFRAMDEPGIIHGFSESIARTGCTISCLKGRTVDTNDSFGHVGKRVPYFEFQASVLSASNISEQTLKNRLECLKMRFRQPQLIVGSVMTLADLGGRDAFDSHLRAGTG